MFSLDVSRAVHDSIIYNTDSLIPTCVLFLFFPFLSDSFVHVFGFTNIHTFELNISLIRLFSLIFNHAKPRLYGNHIGTQCG